MLWTFRLKSAYHNILRTWKEYYKRTDLIAWKVSEPWYTKRKYILTISDVIWFQFLICKSFDEELYYEDQGSLTIFLSKNIISVWVSITVKCTVKWMYSYKEHVIASNGAYQTLDKNRFRF